MLGKLAYSLSYWSSAVIAKSKTLGLVLAVCFKAQTEEQKMQLIGSACLAETKSGTQSSTVGKKVIEIMTSWKISFFFF